VARIKGDS